MRVGRRNRSEVKVTFMVAVMILAFMVAWTPYSVFALIKQFGDADSIGPGMGVLPSLFAKTSICYNPIIYVAMNSQVFFTTLLSFNILLINLYSISVSASF